MNATLRNEARPVLRQHRGVLWCPFCDRSRQESQPSPFCEGCGAEFGAVVINLPAPAPREADSPPDPPSVNHTKPVPRRT